MGGYYKIRIKMDHREVGCGGMDWIELAQDRVLVSIKCGEFLA